MGRDMQYLTPHLTLSTEPLNSCVPDRKDPYDNFPSMHCLSFHFAPSDAFIFSFHFKHFQLMISLYIVACPVHFIDMMEHKGRIARYLDSRAREKL